MLELASVTTDGPAFVATYVGSHSTPGALGTRLEFEVTLSRYRSAPWRAGISFDNCDAPTAAEALRRLALWVGRAAEALDGDPDPNGLPISLERKQ